MTSPVERLPGSRKRSAAGGGRVGGERRKKQERRWEGGGLSKWGLGSETAEPEFYLLSSFMFQAHNEPIS